MVVKRIALIFVALTCFAVAFSSCKKAACKPVSIAHDYKCHADMVAGDVTYSAVLQRGGKDAWKAKFTAPDTIKGMEVTLASDSFTVGLGGLDYSAPKAELPQFGVLDLVTSSLEKCISGEVKCYKNGDKVVQEGKVKGIEFSAEFKKGKLKTLVIGDEVAVKIK